MRSGAWPRAARRLAAVTSTAERTAPGPGVPDPGLSRTADGRLVPGALARLRGREDTDRRAGWIVTLAVTALAGVLRFQNLGYPREFLFDETYYAKDGWSLWRFGYGIEWGDRADTDILFGRMTPSLTSGDPSMVVHPEVGKWLIGAGQQLFGFEPLGWRFPSAVVGTLMVLVMVRLVRRLSGSTLLGGVAGLLLCFDGLHFTLSRLALLDIYVAFFLLCAVSCLVADRDWGRRRLADLAAASPVDPHGWGPVRGLRWRPWRLAAGVLFGLAVASKWSALVPLAGFGLLVLAWDTGARRALGVRLSLVKAAVVDGLPAFGYLVVVAFVVYVASWAGWLLHADLLEQQFARGPYGDSWGSYVEDDPVGFFPSLWDALRSLGHYHAAMWSFHTGGLTDATHTYQSAPQSWLVMRRPVVVAADLEISPGVEGCTAPEGSTCLREIVMLGTPALWWSGVVAWLYTLYAALGRRDWRFTFALVGLATTWLPFFLYADRPIFSFYAITLLPFTIVALTLTLGRVLGPADATPGRRAVGAVATGSVVLLVVLNFAWLWPVLTHELISTPEWLDRIWFRSWI
jgi:dolichyl-phosphate-mannose-protein mannosyltransferase